MRKINIIGITAIWAVAVLSWQGCKKSDSLIVKPEQDNKLQVATNAVTSNDIQITWGTAKAQPTGTHEVHGEVVNNKLYVFGGYDINKRPNWTPTKRSYVYDPVSNTWTSIKSLPYEPYGSTFGGATHFGLTTDGTDIYFAGGYISNADGTGQVFGTKQVWKYNVASNSYTRLPDLPRALAAGQLRYVNGKIHYMGGADLGRNDISAHYALDLSDLAAGWKTLASLNNPVNHPGSGVLNGKLYFLGGAHHQDENTVTQTTLEVYDEQLNKWTDLADMPVGVDHISSSVVTYGNRLLVLGGETSHNVLSNKIQAYDPATNSWTQLTPLPVAKSAGVGAVLNGNIYYTGGNFSNVNHKGTVSTGTTKTVLSPVADAFVRDGTYRTLNYGTDTSLIIKGASSAGYNRKSFLKFSLPNTTSINTAKLRVYGYNSDNSNAVVVTCYNVADQTWAESSLTFDNAPASGQELGNLSVTNQKGYAEIDVTAIVKAASSGSVSFLLKDKNNQNITVLFQSRESTTNKPQLVIE